MLQLGDVKFLQSSFYRIGVLVRKHFSGAFFFLGVVFHWYCRIRVGFLSGRGQNRTYKTLLVISRDLLLRLAWFHDIF